MANKYLDADITNTSDILSINVTQSHDAACSVSTFTCVNTTLDVGDYIEVKVGFDGSTSTVFKGYVKQINRNIPDNTYDITAHDVMTRAVDYFIVGTNPEKGYVYRNITAHALIQTVLQMAGLSSFDFDNTYFTFGIENDVEVNLVSSYDYSRMISDIIAWKVWATMNGVIKLKNRKPYPMDGASGQPGDVADTPIKTITDSSIYKINYGFHERDLRNKMVVYGVENLYKESKKATSLDPATGSYRQILPSGYYKASVLASPLIDDGGFAQKACNYNLALYNKLTYELNMTIEGDPDLESKKTVTISSTKGGVSGDWYIYQLEHSWSSSGYVTNMLLKI